MCMTDIRSTFLGAIIMATGFALGAWLFGNGTDVHAQVANPQPDRYQIVNLTGAGTMLLNRSTGDTFKWYKDDRGMGWQFHALPTRSDNCTTDQDKQSGRFCRAEARERENQVLSAPVRAITDGSLDYRLTVP